jgi:hypothetical protein
MNNNPFLDSAVIVAIVGWIFKTLEDTSERQKKKVNTAEVFLVNINEAVEAIKVFLPRFKAVAKDLIGSTDKPFFTPANDSLSTLTATLEEHLLLLPPNIVSKIILFKSYDVNINELLRDMSHNNFVSEVREKRKEVIVNTTINYMDRMVPLGEELITILQNYIECENKSLLTAAFTAVKKCFRTT